MLENDLAADDGHNAARFQNLRRGNLHDVGEHADVDLACDSASLSV
jgi:hypothetical protein